MSKDISVLIRNGMPGFSKGKRRIADAILHSYDRAAYMTASRLGEMVGVSESTVVRFANELGFEGYPEFQRAVQELVKTKLTPNQRIDITDQRIGEGNLIEKVMHSDIEKIRYTLESIDHDTFSAAVDAII